MNIATEAPDARLDADALKNTWTTITLNIITMRSTTSLVTGELLLMAVVSLLGAKVDMSTNNGR
jgi:hypothetical protein